MSVCLSRRSFLSETDRLALLFLLPSSPNTLVEQMQAFQTSVQQTVWVESYGQRVTLRVAFLNGSPSQQQQVRDVIDAEFNVTHIINVTFVFVPSHQESDIRVTFYPNQYSWSAIGIEAAFVNQDAPTMNLDDVAKGNILHQFAHSLGFPHEHEHETDPIPWNNPVVDAAFSLAPHFWSKDQTKQNFYHVYNLNQFYNYKSFRPNSLMVNGWPCKFFTNDSAPCDLPKRDAFLPSDIAFFKSFYPFLKNRGTTILAESVNLPNVANVQLSATAPDVLTIATEEKVSAPRSKSLSQLLTYISAPVITICILSILVFCILRRKKSRVRTSKTTTRTSRS
jgi:hypothetical protein